MTLKPFFYYYGAKNRAAKLYPAPHHDWIVEPFAGAAGYSCLYPDRKVVLVDLDPIISGLWHYLINVSETEFLGLPDIGAGQTTDDLLVCQEARWLIGFWLNGGSAQPKKSPSAWMLQGHRPNGYWGPATRHRLAGQLKRIRHWRLQEGSYDQIPNKTATWFVDPPYQTAGVHYRKSARDINFRSLGEWCKSRQGQVLVCENEGANWLPFKAFANFKANESKHGGKVSKEVIWYRET